MCPCQSFMRPKHFLIQSHLLFSQLACQTARGLSPTTSLLDRNCIVPTSNVNSRALMEVDDSSFSQMGSLDSLATSSTCDAWWLGHLKASSEQIIYSFVAGTCLTITNYSPSYFAIRLTSSLNYLWWYWFIQSIAPKSLMKMKSALQN